MRLAFGLIKRITEGCAAALLLLAIAAGEAEGDRDRNTKPGGDRRDAIAQQSFREFDYDLHNSRGDRRC